jgi:Ser/Thr protein kinase RdoA (MazF antagonist)
MSYRVCSSHPSVFAAAAQFTPQGWVTGLEEFGRGNVNATFLATPADSLGKPFILQRLNTRVFLHPELVMQNLRVLIDHVHRQARQHQPYRERGWQIPEILPTQDGADFWIDSQGSFWRALSLIDSAQSFDTIQDNNHAREVGYALGTFHLLIHDLPPAGLADTLPGFHVTPGYLQQYDEVLEQYPPEAAPEVDYARRFIELRRGWAPVLEQARRAGVLTERIIHGDPKVNNVLLDAATGKAVSLIDLDTVKPGLVQYDLGDCLRSGCNPLGEETTDLGRVRFELAFCRAILQGYLSQAREFLTPGDYDCMYDAIRLIAFELGLRFFTDYLAGDSYFKATRPRHNLERALIQFRLTESIAAQETAIRSLIKELR